MNRIASRFALCRKQGRAALMTHVTAGDPDSDTSLAILGALVKGGADLIELGIPFSDPAADGPAIQQSSVRALASGQTVDRTLAQAKKFRALFPTIPLVLMGYYNSIYDYGAEAFIETAANAGVDGLIVADLPFEMSHELDHLVDRTAINLIRLVAPNTEDERLKAIAGAARGFIYNLAATGVTGRARPQLDTVALSVKRIRQTTELPIITGFGVRTPEQAAAIAKICDGVVVGSLFSEAIEVAHERQLLTSLPTTVEALASGIRAAIQFHPLCTEW